ncbi:MAG: germination protein YpeB [Clostridia bacterium]|nr:germination protein YpeB [Clostridia bacterium]
MKKWLRRLCTAVLVVALVVAVVLLREEHEERLRRERDREQQIESLYRRIDEDLGDVDVSLSKLTAAASPRQSVLLLGDVWRSTGSAGAAMALLPLSHADSCDMSQFITRCADYAHALMGRVLEGKPLSDRDRQQLDSIRTACAEIRQLTGTAIENGDYLAADTVDLGCYESTQSEAAISEYPTLIYDGPFSESGENQAPRCDPGERISAAAAQKKALRLYPGATVTDCTYVPSRLPTYEITLDTKDRGTVSVSVTEAGGRLRSFMGTPTGNKNDPPSDEESEALKAEALGVLLELGFEDPAAAYAQYYQGVAVLNFAPRQEGVLLYSDLVKVYMDRDTRQVLGLDASHYCLNHRHRDLPAPRLTEAEAREAVAAGLDIQAVTLALIPLTQESEVLCYECKATRGETYFLVYINALTGAEEQIFQVINSSEGDLVV